MEAGEASCPSLRAPTRLWANPEVTDLLTNRMSATMAQFMDSSVSPIKMKIWGIEGGDGGGGKGRCLITRSANIRRVYCVQTHRWTHLI